MKSVVEQLSPTRVKLSIDVTFDELKPHISAAYQSLSERINIPGFRKGKVPAAMIDQRVGRGAVLDEAINAALPTFYSQAAKENDVLVIGRPTVDIKELKDNESLSFTVEVDVRPDLKLPNFSQIEIVVDDVAVSDKDLEEQIDALRARFGTLSTVEKKVETANKNSKQVKIDPSLSRQPSLLDKVDFSENNNNQANNGTESKIYLIA